MIGLHRVFREALAGSDHLIGDVAEHDTDRAGLVGSYYANVLALLHSHHESEDELLTPRLLKRMPDHAPTISRIGQQHQAGLAARARPSRRSPPGGRRRPWPTGTVR